MTATIACDVVPFISLAVETTEGHEIGIDTSESDDESKKSSSESHNNVKVTVAQGRRRQCAAGNWIKIVSHGRPMSLKF